MFDNIDTNPRLVAKRVAPVVAVLSATPVVVWWLVGDLSESPDALDYFITPPALSDSTITMLGLSALAVLCVGVLMGLRLVQQSLLSIGQVVTALPLVAVGVFGGFTARVFTAAVSGANLGAGLMMLFGMVFVPNMLLLSYLLHRRGQAPLPARAEDRLGPA